MQFTILGEVEARAGDVLVDMGPPRQRCVLAALLVDAGRPVSLEKLIDRVWGEEPPNAVRNVVYTYMTRLRQAMIGAHEQQGLECEVRVARSSTGYRLLVPAGDVDLLRFRSLVAQARSATTDEERSTLLGRALALYRGTPLGGLRGDWAQRQRESLEQVHRELLVEWTDVKLRLGDPAEAIAPLREAVGAAPLMEPLRERLITSLHHAGRTVEALEQYSLARAHFAEQLGADPSARMQQLQLELLSADPYTPAPAARQRPVLAAVAQEHPRAPDDAAGQNAATPGPIDDAAGVRPQCLPPGLADFVGRDDVIARIERALLQTDDRSPATVVLTGGGGVGKTAVAVHAAHRVSDAFPDGQLFARLSDEEERAVDPARILRRFLRMLGSPVSEGASREELADLFRTAIAGRRILVVLDDLICESQARWLLPGNPACAVLITGRRRDVAPDGSTVIQLPAFSQEEATLLITKAIGPPRVLREPAAVAELIGLCGALPIALRAAAARLSARPHWSIAHLVSRLRDDRRRLEELALGSTGVRTILRRSYHALPPSARTVFNRLAALPCQDFAGSGAAAAALGLERSVTEDTLEQLVDAHLVDGRHGVGAEAQVLYRVGSLQRAYAHALGSHRRPATVA